MRITPLHAEFKAPTRGSDLAGAFDIYMPEPGMANGTSQLFGLGFAAAVPPGWMAILQPRSSTGAKHGLELNNTTGWIDADYRGQWKAALRTKSGLPFSWEAGERVLQFTLVPVYQQELQVVAALEETARGSGGFGSTGQ